MGDSLQFETLEERALMAGNMAMPMPMGIPDFAAHPTVASVADGNWSEARVWSTGRAPTTGDIVSIGTHVRYDVASDARLATVAITMGGELNFAPTANTRLMVGNFEVMAGGSLVIGTQAAPIVAKAEIIFLDQAPDTMMDPEQFGTGLVALGNVSMQGQAKADYLRLAAEPAAGQTILSLSAPATGWRVGDRIYVPDSRQIPLTANWETNNELRTVAAISADGKTVTLDRALSFAHKGARDGDDVLTFLPYVANLTRNVSLRSENPTGTRGHSLFTGTGAVSIKDVGFYDMGRTTNALLNSTKFDPKGMVTHVGSNQIGRYALHMHHFGGPSQPNSSGHQFVLEGNVVYSTVPTSRWGITIHESHHGLIKDNVVVAVAGAGIVTESGAESYNAFIGNFVSGVSGKGRPDARTKEFAFEGSAFWFRGANNYVRDNIANGATYGFTYYAQYAPTNLVRPAAPGMAPSIPINLNATPILQFENNEVAGASKNGFTMWWIGTLNEKAIENMATSTVKNLKVWHTCNGVSGYPTSDFTFDGVTIIGDRAQINEFGGGMGFSDYMQKDLVIKNANIQNMRTGITTPALADVRGASGSNPGLVLIENVYLRNQTNLIVQAPWHNANGKNLSPILVDVRNGRFASVQGKTPPSNIRVGTLGGEFANHTQWVALFVHGYNGDPNDNFQVYSAKQAPDALVKETAKKDRIIGAPEPGLTNADAWAKYGIANLGGVSPTTATRSGIEGFVLPVSPTQPMLRPPGNRTITEGDAFTFAVSAFNPKLRALQFALESPPAGMTIDPVKGIVNWSAKAGTYTVTVRVSDSVEPKLTATMKLTLTVAKVAPAPATTSAPTTLALAAPTPTGSSPAPSTTATTGMAPMAMAATGAMNQISGVTLPPMTSTVPAIDNKAATQGASTMFVSPQLSSTVSPTSTASNTKSTVTKSSTPAPTTTAMPGMATDLGNGSVDAVFGADPRSLALVAF